jgi:hypothetical protein
VTKIVAIDYGGTVDIARDGSIAATLQGSEGEFADAILSRNGWVAVEDWGPEKEMGGGEIGREAEIERVPGYDAGPWTWDAADLEGRA